MILVTVSKVARVSGGLLVTSVKYPAAKALDETTYMEQLPLEVRIAVIIKMVTIRIYSSRG